MTLKLLDLPEGQVLLDEDDYVRLGGRSIYLSSNGYPTFSTNALGPITLHSFVMRGTMPGMHIDHIDGNKMNNCKSNLRFVTTQLNQANRHCLNKNNSSGIRGVARTNASTINPWRAQITVNRKNVYLGLFPTAEEAITARRAAELEYYGVECPRV